ncbi:hypothetical protein [Microcoleus sp. A2-C5]|uniref:hypothetical protein n=1 Tax=Microcoleus sp. A2-C5 TaxID=2818533 RepID=UPI002FD00515
MEGFVGHDRILVVLAVILAKDTLFDRKESSTLTASRPVDWQGGSDRTVAISTPARVRPSIVRVMGCSERSVFCDRSQSYY